MITGQELSKLSDQSSEQVFNNKCSPDDNYTLATDNDLAYVNTQLSGSSEAASTFTASHLVDIQLSYLGP